MRSRNPVRRAVAAVTGWALVAGLVVVAGTLTAPGPPAGATGPTVTGSGGSYPAVAIDAWVGQVEARYGDNINYSTSSSVIGLDEFAQQQVDFGASEIGYSTNQASYSPPPGYQYQYLPDVAGATCIMYNVDSPITGQPFSSLQLTTPMLMGMVTGTITTWGQLAQGGLNAELQGDSSPLITVFRTDPSGDNYILSDYLNTLDPTDWAKFNTALGFPGGPQALWPFPQNGNAHPGYNFSNWIGQSGSDNASQYVTSTPGTFTYVETAYAQLHHLPCAAIQNLPQSSFVQPSAYNDAVALLQAQLLPDLEQELGGVFTDTAPNAYPISAYSYLITQESQFPAAKGAVLGQFIQYFACQGQVSAEQLGYSPLPPNLVLDDFQAISRINGAAPPPASVNPTTCNDPYVALFGGTDPSTVAPPSSTGSTGPGAGTDGATAQGAGTSAAALAAAAAAAKAAAARHHHGSAGNGLVPGQPGGPVVGLALSNAIESDLDHGGPGGPAWFWPVGVTALLVVPPAVVWWVRRRRRRTAPTGATS